MNATADPPHVEQTKSTTELTGHEYDLARRYVQLETSAAQYSSRQLRNKTMPPSTKALVEVHYSDRSPSKPQRRYSPGHTRCTIAESEKVEHCETYQVLDFYQATHDPRQKILPPNVPISVSSSDIVVGCVIEGGCGKTGSPGRCLQPPFYEQSEKVSTTRRAMIQVAPDVIVPLRGSEETWEAIKDDFYLPALCLGCENTVFVIQDAAYVLCPECRVVSAMEGDFMDRTSAGVGLGFTYDELIRCQAEVLAGHR